MNKKQELFCREYLIDFNATQAAIRTGYSEKSAYSIGHENLKKPEIKERIEQLSLESFKTIGLNRDRIVTEMVELAFSKDTSQQIKFKALEFLHSNFQSKSSKNDEFKANAQRVLDRLSELKKIIE